MKLDELNVWVETQLSNFNAKEELLLKVAFGTDDLESVKDRVSVVIRHGGVGSPRETIYSFDGVQVLKILGPYITHPSSGEIGLEMKHKFLQEKANG